jgi:hypothetical protein
MDNILKEIGHEIDKEISQIQVMLGDGVCEDYAQYKQLVGTIVGLKKSKELIKTIYTNMINGDDDADN